MKAVAPVLLLAIGNESRGDDALGPLLLRRLEKAFSTHEDFELLEEFQLQVEHALDIRGRRLVLFIDAGDKTTAPFSFYPSNIKRPDSPLAHALTPDALLGVYAKVHGESPPPTYVLCIAGVSFGLGAALSAEAEANMEQAFDFACQLMTHASDEVWKIRAQKVALAC